MNCPACGRPRVEADECPHCGVIYARARSRHVVAPPASKPAATTAGTSSLPRLLRWIPLALVLAGLAAAVALRRPPPPASEASAPAARPPAQASNRPAATPAAEVLPAALAADPAPPGRPEPAPEPPACAAFDPSGIEPAQRPAAVSAEWHPGASGYQGALREQASSGAPLLLLFFTDWCKHCRRFIEEVIPSPEARALGERIVKAKVNAQGDAGERELAARFAVRSYPTLLLFAGGGAPPVRLTRWGSPKAFVENCEGAMPNRARERLEQGIALARDGANADRAAAELKAAAGDGALATVALDQLGLLALRSSCFTTAVTIYERLLGLDAGYQGGRAQHLRGLARFRSGDRSGALQDADEACRRGFREACTAADGLRGAAR